MLSAGQSSLHRASKAFPVRLVGARYAAQFSRPALPKYGVISGTEHGACSVPLSLSKRLKYYRAHEPVRDLHHVDARAINTSHFGTAFQDSMEQSQNCRSFDYYVEYFRSLLCFCIRVKERNHFCRPRSFVADTYRSRGDAAGVKGAKHMELSMPAGR